MHDLDRRDRAAGPVRRRAGRAAHLRPVDNVVVPISRRLQLVQLNERTCKWPNGDPLSEDFNFCGNDAAETGPYCNYHARIAFQPASERRRSRCYTVASRTARPVTGRNRFRTILPIRYSLSLEPPFLRNRQ